MELSNAEMNTSQIANSLYKKNLKEEKKWQKRSDRSGIRTHDL